MPNYTKDKLIEKSYSAIKSPATFYKQDFIRNEELLEDGITFRTEVIAKYICDNFEQFDCIKSIRREKTYKTEGHDGDNSDSKDKNLSERKLAKVLFGKSLHDDYMYEEIGEIVDYEVPLKNTNKDVGVGKIDLLAINDEKKFVYILELKKKDNCESILRCVLEGYTYSKIVDRKHLFESFDIPGYYDLRPATLVFKEKLNGNRFMRWRRGKDHI